MSVSFNRCFAALAGVALVFGAAIPSRGDKGVTKRSGVFSEKDSRPNPVRHDTCGGWPGHSCAEDSAI